MIASLHGQVIRHRNSSIIIETAGVGFEVQVANPMAYGLNETVFLLTYQQFREDGQTLFGFDTEEEYALFTLLTSVKGIGCKSAMNALAAKPADEILSAIENEDVKALKSLPGIGPRTAGQIILDLKGKVLSVPRDQKGKTALLSNPVWKQTREALEALGYKDNELDALNSLFEDDKEMDEGTMLRKALQQLALRRGY